MTTMHRQPGSAAAVRMPDLADELTRVRHAYNAAVESETVLRIGLSAANSALECAAAELTAIRRERDEAFAAVAALQVQLDAALAAGPVDRTDPSDPVAATAASEAGGVPEAVDVPEVVADVAPVAAVPADLPVDPWFRSSAHEFAALQEVTAEELANAEKAAAERRVAPIEVLPEIVEERKPSLLRLRRP